MPNWAFGYVNVTGTRDGIKSFIERFVSEDDPSTIPGKRFFARSFIQSKRQAFIDEAMKEFSEPAVDAKASYSFVASFAWSAYSCLIGGYPQNSPTRVLDTTIDFLLKRANQCLCLPLFCSRYTVCDLL